MTHERQPSFDDPVMGLVSSGSSLSGMPTRELKPPRVPIDVTRLIETRLLVQANSGGGKTWANRRLLEQTYGLVQHIVIDPEGEMHTLREKLDYVLAAPKGGDCPADLKSAPLLARKLLELGASAIIDIYDLGTQRTRFVKLFLESLMNAPREMWQPVLVLIEEAHKFCPERGEGEAESTEAVKDLMTRGRKRGYCGVLSTQRLSALHKSAAAECNNRLIGRTALDVDQDRAAKVLGFDRKRAQTLAELDDGHFYAFGPALCKQVTEIKIGANQTTHEKAGQRRKGPTPPRERVRQMLAQLADLPHEAEVEAKTIEQLKARVRELEIEARKSVNKPVLEYDPVIKEENEQLRATANQLREAEESLRIVAMDAVSTARSMTRVIAEAVRDLNAGCVDEVSLDLLAGKVPARIAGTQSKLTGPSAPWVAKLIRGGGIPKTAMATDLDGQPINGFGGGVKLSKCERAMLTALAQHWGGLTKRQVLIHTVYAKSGTTDNAFSKFRREQWVTQAGDIISITDAGRKALGSYTPLPSGSALRSEILAKCSAAERKIFDFVCEMYPNDVAKSDVLEAAGYAKSGTTDNVFSKFTTLGYFHKTGTGRVKAAEELF